MDIPSYHRSLVVPFFHSPAYSFCTVCIATSAGWEMGFSSMQTSAFLTSSHFSKWSPFIVHADTAPTTEVNYTFQRHPRNWRVRKKKHGEALRTNVSQGFRAMADSSSRRYRKDPKEVIMVDPLEAKRLAAVQMQQLQAKAKLKRQREIEAINGGWAMLGLTAGLVIEGYTGNDILSQLASYLNALAAFLDQHLPF